LPVWDKFCVFNNEFFVFGGGVVFIKVGRICLSHCKLKTQILDYMDIWLKSVEGGSLQT
jgi:hypothetical protein